jgi:hypothetical protein
MEVEKRRNLAGSQHRELQCPFLMRRAWCHGIKPPPFMKGRCLNYNFVDLKEVWEAGIRMARISLNALAKFLKVGGKNGEGGNFAKTLKSYPAASRAHLLNDFDMTWKVAARMAVI